MTAVLEVSFLSCVFLWVGDVKTVSSQSGEQGFKTKATIRIDRFACPALN